MKIRLREPEATPPALDSRAFDCAWDQVEKRWRVFSDDCGSFLCFATAEQIKARFRRQYNARNAAWVFHATPEAMTASDRETFNRTGQRPTTC